MIQHSSSSLISSASTALSPNPPSVSPLPRYSTTPNSLFFPVRPPTSPSHPPFSCLPTFSPPPSHSFTSLSAPLSFTSFIVLYFSPIPTPLHILSHFSCSLFLSSTSFFCVISASHRPFSPSSSSHPPCRPHHPPLPLRPPLCPPYPPIIGGSQSVSNNNIHTHSF